MNRLTQYVAKTIKQVKDCPECAKRREAIMANIKAFEERFRRGAPNIIATKPVEFQIKRG